MLFTKTSCRLSLAATLWVTIACCTAQVQAGLITATTTTLDPIAPGDVVDFDIELRNVALPSPTDSIISITLDFTASDAALTVGGTDFSGFSFVPDAGLIGSLSFSFDPDVSDDGIVTLDADTPPFGSDTGIPEATAYIRLGTLSAVAPPTPGDYTIGFLIDNTPFANSTTLLLDDFDFTTLVPDVQGASFTVTSAATVPEPASLLVFGCAGGCLVFCRRRKDRGNATTLCRLS
ncbi:hypothetical protein Pla52o_11020 [Novipirellula galeiformis]|uniref:PEP-CTERM protein-sorting domain-containing protein n=1 Tax=Novipirellula galeiformis TaxID=2528004 RepID=A0A5C6CK89_9BACT|nr:PEP-CTERM sorting domain-containing protein [Novipirellula galeiformis]TWU24812.1 hypothetical protein Pla52o_11020 [Novipirellula galeiformis]